jgi:hypothetical protein
MIAHGQIVIPEGQGGDWTFSVNSDDGFELYIPGARFEPAPGFAYATQYGSLFVPYDRSASDSLGHSTLQAGVHDIELIYYENRLKGTVELSAARGPGGPTPTEEVSSLTDAKSLLGAPDTNDLSVSSMVESLNHDNIPIYLYGRFTDDAGFISGNDVAIIAYNCWRAIQRGFRRRHHHWWSISDA